MASTHRAGNARPSLRAAIFLFALLGTLSLQPHPLHAQDIHDILRLLTPFQQPGVRSGPAYPPAQSPGLEAPSAAVAQAQSLLNALGYDAGPADGAFGGRTLQALNAFQRDQRIAVTRGLDRGTLMALERASQAPGGATQPTGMAAAQGPGGAGPSFDCGAARQLAEKTICASLEISALDRQLDEAFRQAVARAPDKQSAARLRDEQRSWIAQRQGCQKNRECLSSLYLARLHDLAGSAAAAAPPSVGGSNGGEVSFGPPTRPMTIIRIDGIPVISPEVSPHGATLLHLAAFAASPDVIDQRPVGGGSAYAEQLALDVLPMRSPAQEAYLSGSGFRGNNEFERKATKDRFFAEYGPKMRAMAPKPPFWLALAQRGTLGQYDEARQGFSLGAAPNAAAGHYFTNFLKPRLLKEAQTPEMFWPLSPANAEAELRQLAADSGQSSGGRSIFKVAIVEVTGIDAVTRTADVVLHRYEVYDQGFSRKLYTIPLEGSPEPPTQPSPPRRDGPDVFAGLLNLPGAYERWNVRFYEGSPLFGEHQADKLLFASVLEKLEPGLLAKNTCMLADLLKPQIRERYMRQCTSNGPVWAGGDEFERSATAEAFTAQDFSKALREAAPDIPFRFSYVDDVQLGEYVAASGGFPNRWTPPEFGQGVLTQGGWGRQGGGGASTVIVDAPAPLVKMPLAEARRLTGEMTNWRFKPQAQYQQERLGGRWLRRVTTYEVIAYDATSSRFTLMMKAMALYDGEMKRKVYDFPVGGSDLPLQFGNVPPKLVTAAPAPLNPFYLLSLALGTEAANAETAVLFERLKTVVRERDAGYYRDGRQTPQQFPADDARRAFYTRDAISGQNAHMQQFPAFARAVAAGLPDVVVVTSDVYRGNIRSGYAFGAGTYLGNVLQQGEFATLLAASGLQEDQVSKTTYGNVTFLLALPNRRSLYTIPADPALGTGSSDQPISQTARFKVAGVKRLSPDGGVNPTYLVMLDPQSLSVSVDGRALAERRFDDVPRLVTFSPGGTKPAQEPPASAPGPVTPLRDGDRSIPYDARSADLIALAFAGDALSSDALAYRVLRRWRDEDSADEPLGGRFFTRGKRSPTVEEARAMGPKLSAWARQRLGEKPLRIVLEGSVKATRLDGMEFWPWRIMTCLGDQELASAASAAKWRQPSAALLSQKSFGQNGTNRWTPEDERKLIASAAVGKATDFVHPLQPGKCSGAPLQIAFNDKAQTFLVVSDNLPALPGDRIRDGETVTLAATLEMRAIDIRKIRPDDRSLLPDSITALAPAPTQSQPQGGEFLVLDTSLVEAVYSDGNGQELFRTKPDERYSLARIIESFEKEAAAVSAAPIFDFPHDIVGLRLGMSFEEAEKIIRAHMKVAKVIEGRRTQDRSSAGAFLLPATSGRLFVGEGERELIAIIDEPPAVEGRILVAWRRVYFEPGKVPEAEVIESLRAKYGMPSSRTISAGVRNYWSTPLGNNCQAGYQSGGMRTALGAAWVENGKPFSLTLPDNGLASDAFLPGKVRQPQEPAAAGGGDCGPVFTAEFSFDASRTLAAGYPVKSLDWIEQIISNAQQYADAFNANRNGAQGARAEDGGAPAKPSIRF